MHGQTAPAIFPSEGGTAIGWRHGTERSAQFVFRDGHVASFVPKSNGLSSLDDLKHKTFNTTSTFAWLPGEFPSRARYDTYVPGTTQYDGGVEAWAELTGKDRLYPKYAKVKQAGYAGGKVLAPNENFHPYAYPDELNASWRTLNKAWRNLPDEQAGRR
jgi:hypothetical protein